MRKTYLYIGAFLLVLGSAACSPEVARLGDPPINVSENWTYRLLLDETRKIYGPWKKLEAGGLPLAERRKSGAIFEMVLPEGQWGDPGLYIASAMFDFDVYLGDDLIYQPRKNAGVILYQVRYWHIIPLGSNFAGKTLRLEVKSSGGRVFGLMRDSFVGSRSEHIYNIFFGNLLKFLVGCLYLFSGVWAFLAGLKRLGEGSRIYFSFGLLIFFTGTLLVTHTEIKQLLWESPVFWEGLGVFEHLRVVGLFLFFEHLFGAGPFRIVRRLWQLHLLVTLARIPLYYMSFFMTPPPAELILEINMGMFLVLLPLYVLDSVSILLLSLRVLREGDRRAWPFLVLACGTIAMMLPLIIGQFEVLNWYYENGHWVVMLFLISMAYILVREFTDTQSRLGGLEIELAEKDRALKEAELKSLQEKINPVFLFDSLKDIETLIVSEEEQADRALLLLADIYRTILDNSNEYQVTFQEEWQLLEQYFEFLNIRHGNCLALDLKCDASLKEKRLPPLVLHRLNERIGEIGIADRNGGARLKVAAAFENETFAVRYELHVVGADKEKEGLPPILNHIKERLLLDFSRVEALERKSRAELCEVLIRWG